MKEEGVLLARCPDARTVLISINFVLRTSMAQATISMRKRSDESVRLLRARCKAGVAFLVRRILFVKIR